MGDRTCSVNDCDGRHYAKGMCRSHYRRDRKTRTGKPIQPPLLVHRISNVDPSGKTGDCMVCGPGVRIKVDSIGSSKGNYCRGNRRLLQADIAIIKLRRGCVDCGYRVHAEALDFDHIPGRKKLGNVSQLFQNHASREVIMAEIAKCEVVCANCHRVRTANRRNQNAS